MKFIKYAVGLVIALSVIPLLVVTVNNLDTPKLKTVEFEVVDYDEVTYMITFSENTYNDINSLAINDTKLYVSNLIIVKLNDNVLEYESYKLDYDIFNGNFGYIYNNGVYWNNLNDDNTAEADEYDPTIGDKWTMTFEVSIMPPLVKLLVGFVPLIFVGGILLFMLNKRKKEE